MAGFFGRGFNSRRLHQHQSVFRRNDVAAGVDAGQLDGETFGVRRKLFGGGGEIIVGHDRA